MGANLHLGAGAAFKWLSKVKLKNAEQGCGASLLNPTELLSLERGLNKFSSLSPA